MISVIIPAYNAEKTIDNAIQSALGNIPDAEVIVVENGSTDNTGKVIEAAAQKYENVVAAQSKKGVSAARNAGLEIARGEWIMFLDADDSFLPCASDVVAECIKDKTTDFWIFGHEAGREKRVVIKGNSVKVISAGEIEQIRVKMIKNPTRYMQAWGKIFKASIIKDNNLRFNENMQLAEDSDFTMRYSAFCEKISLSPEILYHYALDPSSTMRNDSTEKVKQYAHAMEESKESISSESENIKNAFRKYVLMHFNIAIVRGALSLEGKMLSKSERIARIKEASGMEVFATAIKETRIKECFSLRMLPIFFIKNKMYGCAYLIYKARIRQNTRREAL